MLPVKTVQAKGSLMFSSNRSRNVSLTRIVPVRRVDGKPKPLNFCLVGYSEVILKPDLPACERA
jgi:hypothetical protein